MSAAEEMVAYEPGTRTTGGRSMKGRAAKSVGMDGRRIAVRTTAALVCSWSRDRWRLRTCAMLGEVESEYVVAATDGELICWRRRDVAGAKAVSARSRSTRQ